MAEQPDPNAALIAPAFFCPTCGSTLMRLMKQYEVEQSLDLYPWWCGGCHAVFALPYWIRQDFSVRERS